MNIQIFNKEHKQAITYKLSFVSYGSVNDPRVKTEYKAMIDLLNTSPNVFVSKEELIRLAKSLDQSIPVNANLLKFAKSLPDLVTFQTKDLD